VRLVTYNIQAGIAATAYRHYLTRGLRHVLPSRHRFPNLDRMAGTLRDYDVVGVQEADAGSLRCEFVNLVSYLAEQGRFPHWYHQVNRPLGKLAQHSLGLLSRFPVAGVTEHRLPGTIPGRGALIATLGAGRHSLVVITVHLALGARARRRQIDYLGELASGHRHVVVMGDFNFRSDSREMEVLLLRSGLSEPAHGLHSFPSWRPRRGIDHILVSPALVVEGSRVLDIPFSDHLPVTALVAVPPLAGLPARDAHPRRAEEHACRLAAVGP
jgi:endonuclease/exonuclease/phosphatase family metal-dependent hydrolase